MSEKRVTIADIADELGVSTATVSNVIHGKTKKVSSETVRRVQALLEEKRYIPSMAGVLLARNSSGIIGVVVNDHEKYESHVLEDAFIASSLNALSAEIEKAGYFMMVKVTGNWQEIVRLASMWNMEGLVVIGFCEQDYKSLRDAMHIPFVIYDGYLTGAKRLCNLTIDNYQGGYQMGAYFYRMGHRNVLCISDNEICMDWERKEGFFAAMKEGQADFRMIPMEKTERKRYYTDNLEILKRYSGIFAVSDYYAVELIQFLQQHNIRVPEEISVAGFDDTPLCELIVPALTTIRQDNRQRAKVALELLKGLKAGTVSGGSYQFPTVLVERQSVCHVPQIEHMSEKL